MQNSEPVWRHVDEKAGPAIELSDRVWGMPELAYNEHRSAAEHTAYLQAEGFRVTEQLAGIPTAMMGEAGEEGPVIAILGEFDALPGLSNEAGVAQHTPVPGDGNGHACGHNLLGAASLLAATAVKDYLAANGIKGRVRYYGCPAEEGGAAKGFMARAGLFDDVDIAISWHPSAFAGVNEPISLANTRIDFTFHGRASHAAAAPHLGRSALDAVELMSVGVNYLREHIPSESRIHYAYLDAGGVAPNVVQAKAKVRYLIRAADVQSLNRLVTRVRKIADGAALMTETRVETQVISAVSNLLGNTPLERLMQDSLDRLGPPPFDAEDMKRAAEFQATLSEEDIESAYKKVGMPRTDSPLADRIVPLDSPRAPMVGSTDVGDVSWKVPTVQARGATHAIGTALHSWQATAQGKLPHAHKGMVHVAKVMAGTAVDALKRPEIIAAAKAEHHAKTGGVYHCPLPEDATPPIGMSLTV
ncbi:M20 family metallopeptidase [Roseococcus suduntuyensis]|uniref:Aminobenzoyl-glutamate utilization protein B n=1 Tax=Roseococcus suduntuyensis TaxID=455361 RepID=A0A840A881_9PROT|nr:M20 family metallopeptidase [Roseococcus suduntuyensis]MBB3897411.1 aminobenzoyl-glutamate utilization protein B [Roseococcus suduntuyensis]